MKFSEIEKERWDELSPYLDTCLLPVTGMTGMEKPHEATERLEELRDMLDLVEIPFKGRVVTYPACHYQFEGAEFAQGVEEIVKRLKASGFAYVILATASAMPKLDECGADLILRPDATGERPDSTAVAKLVKELWMGGAPS